MIWVSTPLTLACVNASAGMVDKLLTAGADPNTALPTGETALMTCARTGNRTAVKALLARRANVNARDRTRGQTALMWAAAARQTGVVEALLELGADVNSRSEVTTGLVYTGMRYITSPPPVSSGTVVEINQGGFTPLLFVAQQGDVATAKVLMAAGANANDTAPVGTSALVLAVHSDNEAVATYLLDQGADPNAAGAGYTALHAAVLRGNLQLVKTLLARGANPDARLEKGTPVKKYSQDYALSAAWVGATPLWLAARFGEASIARELAAAGADPQAALNDGTTPVLAAVVPSQGIRDRRERYLYPIEAAAVAPDEGEKKTLDTVKLMVELGSSVGASNQAGDTAVHLAASAGFGSVIQFLADKGVDLQATNKRGLTPLALASGAGGRGGASGNTAAATTTGRRCRWWRQRGERRNFCPRPGRPGASQGHCRVAAQTGRTTVRSTLAVGFPAARATPAISGLGLDCRFSQPMVRQMRLQCPYADRGRACHFAPDRSRHPRWKWRARSGPRARARKVSTNCGTPLRVLKHDAN